MSQSCDFFIVGVGIVGLTAALELKRRYPTKKVIAIDKEEQLAFHSSGRNSGVLHAGFYYSADSLKAKFTLAGNQYLRDFCKTKGLRLNSCGKLVVTKSAQELESLAELFRRAKLNGVELHEIDEQETKKIEPRAKTFQKAAWSPTTSTVDPIEVMAALAAEAKQLGVELRLGEEFISAQGTEVKTSKGAFSVGFLLNAAGLYADRIAHGMGCSQGYRILPFKGLYLYCAGEKQPLRTHIYPVPNLKNPFLGVHHTLTVDGHSKIGPTAIPAFWREQYQGFSRFKFAESASIIRDEIGLFFRGGFDFRSLALEEIKKYSRDYLVQEAATMAVDVHLENYQKWGRPGIRAQLMNVKTKKLEMDFIVEKGPDSLHVLNAVSPAFTCSVPFAKYICDQII